MATNSLELALLDLTVMSFAIVIVATPDVAVNYAIEASLVIHRILVDHANLINRVTVMLVEHIEHMPMVCVNVKNMSPDHDAINVLHLHSI